MIVAGVLLILCASQALLAQNIAEKVWQLSNLSGFNKPENMVTPFVPKWNVSLMTAGYTNVQHGSNNVQYGSNNVQHGSNNIQHGSNNVQDGNNNQQHGAHNVQHGSNNVQRGSNNVQHGTNNVQQGSHKVQTGNNGNQYMEHLNITFEEYVMRGGDKDIMKIPVGEDIYFSNRLTDRSNDAVHFKVERNDVTTAENDVQDELVITVTSSRPLHSGDTLMIRPRNCQEHVDDLFRMFNKHGLDIQPEYKLLVEEIYPDMPVPDVLRTPVTVHRIAEQYWDLKAYATPNVFALLAHISEDKLEKDRCIELSSTEGNADLLNYSQKTILEVLNDFPETGSKLTVPTLFELFSTIKPQSFSIAGSYLKTPNSLDISVPLVENITPLKMEGKGLCTNWMANLRKEDEIYGYVKQA